MKHPLAVMALVFGLAGCAAAQPITVTVQTNPQKWNGQPWDGIEVWGPVNAPTTTPPDLVLCVVTATGPERCITGTGASGNPSPCPNSLSCSFTLPALEARQPFGLFIYDADLRAHDLVDMVIVVPTPGAPVPAALEAALRGLADRLTPAISPMERDRRSRATFTVTRDQCRQGCALGQAVLAMP